MEWSTRGTGDCCDKSKWRLTHLLNSLHKRFEFEIGVSLPKERNPILVSGATLKAIAHLASDAGWAKDRIQAELAGMKVDWTNYKSVIGQLNRGTESWAKERFDDNYPDFHKLVDQHTVPEIKGFSLAWLLLPLLGLSYFLIIQNSSSFFRNNDFGNIVLGLLVIGWPYVLGFVLLTFAATFVRLGRQPAIKPTALLKKRDETIASLRDVLERQVNDQIMSLFYLSTSTNPEDLIKSVYGKWVPQGPRPLSPESEISPKEAEEFVAAQLRFHGATGVAVTRFSKDGGVDVKSDLFVAQVKHQSANVGVKTVRELQGVTSSAVSPLVFAKSGFSREAIEFANLHNMGLFTYLPHLSGANPLADAYLSKGFSKRLVWGRSNP
jgi:hypothetical protein